MRRREGDLVVTAEEMRQMRLDNLMRRKKELGVYDLITENIKLNEEQIEILDEKFEDSEIPEGISEEEFCDIWHDKDAIDKIIKNMKGETFDDIYDSDIEDFESESDNEK